MFTDPERFYFLGKKGSTSDDYDHACMTVEAICASGGVVDLFARELACRIKVWAACIPGGIGLATLKSSIKLWCGVDPKKSGVFSAGNGPAMRSHIIGACIDDPQQMVNFVRASTIITHSDPKAFAGALVIALASRYSATSDKVEAAAFLDQVTRLVQAHGCDSGLIPSINDAVQSIGRGEATQEFALRYGRHGVSGYIYHTVPVVIHAWLSHPEDLMSALRAVIACGGDTDTTGSIVGGIVGARVGLNAIPKPLVDGIILWPRGVLRSVLLASKLQQGKYESRVPAWQYLLRNAWFNSVVLLHGLRRLGPPY
jgi:ADP-ribosylglycohydrolase